jgi:LacI family transcriptional regulator
LIRKYTNFNSLKNAEAALACIRQPAFELGQVAMELLIQLIEAKHPTTKFETRVLNTELAVRASSVKS